MPFTDLLWNSGKDNMGGIVGDIYFCPSEDIESLPALSEVGSLQTAVDDIVCKAGKKFHKIYHTTDTGKLDSNTVGDIDGKSKQNLLSFFYPGDDETLAAQVRLLQNTPGVYICNDSKGRLRILGVTNFDELSTELTLESPAYIQITAGTTGAAGADRRGTTFEVVHKAPHRAVFYMGDVPVAAVETIEFGEILNDNFARAEAGDDYTASGSATWACNGSALTLIGVSAVNTDRFRYNYGHSSERNIQRVTVQLTEAPATDTGGVGVGFYDYNSPDGERSLYVRLITKSDHPSFGKAVIVTYDGSTNVTRGTTASALTIQQNDVFTFELVKTISEDGASRFDVTISREAGGSITTGFTELLVAGDTSGQYGYSTGEFCLHAFGGNFTITNWTIEIQDKKNIDAIFIGDSITHGAFSDSLFTRYGAVAGDSLYADSYEISAGNGDVTQRVLDKMDNLLQYNATRYFLMIGGNDLQLAVSDAIWKANYLSIVSQIKGAGKQVIHLLSTPRNTVDVTTLNDWIGTTFPTDTIIDTFTPLVGTGTSINPAYAADDGVGVHPNEEGHALLGSTIVSAL